MKVKLYGLLTGGRNVMNDVTGKEFIFHETAYRASTSEKRVIDHNLY